MSEQVTVDKDLEQKIQARKQLLDEVLGFTIQILNEWGEETYRDQGNSNTHTKRELREFGRFSFFGDFGQTMFGGNNIKIVYHHNDGDITVLEASQQAGSFNSHDCNVQLFNDSVHWEFPFKETIANKSEIIAHRRKTKEEESSTEEQARKNTRSNRALAEEAKRLGIT